MKKSSASLKSRPLNSGGQDDNVQIIRDGSGLPAFAVVPWTDFERLIAGDNETAALIAAGEAARGDEKFPEAVARRLAAGESPVKVIREWRGMTQVQLAEATGLAEKYISQLERPTGNRNVGRQAAEKMAPVLKVSPDVLRD